MSGAALLDDPVVVGQIHRFTLNEYHRLADNWQIDQRTELIEGVIINKMPKSPLHVYLIETLREILASAFKAGYLVRQEQPLSIPALQSEPEPDLCVVRGTKDDFLNAHPHTAEVVVEVAVSSLPLDRAKLRGYALAQIPEVWIVRADNHTVEIYRKPEGDGYSVTSVMSNDAVLLVHGKDVQVQTIFPKNP
ncbi:Uma2 family endonuclease [Turneriella parva]|uniref:Putative restriction endonuclease domain-containing protein n=1 Tax=Turneriella parva (strain ATCC BAA-1111 / DSM 21527 / NCTC 11395 / H) TaxID=869212 RepID=I4B4B5_TURPD|nr:Uma2 family endonuclease [Turneriella parva]AFM12122.1 protein of unknown function DUF820 [Turneriella parva DSM 21527]